MYRLVLQTGIFTAAGPLKKGLETLLGLWAIVTFVFFTNAIFLNIALSALFFMLTITFALLSAGEGSRNCEIVSTSYGPCTNSLLHICLPASVFLFSF